MAEEDSKKSLTCSRESALQAHNSQYHFQVPSLPQKTSHRQTLDSISFNQKIKTERNPIIWMASSGGSG
jgi:hypothetical protein